LEKGGNMEFSALSSGSSGNCFFVKSEKGGILIDAGISCRKIEERLNSLGVSMESVKGVFISHEHSDHVRGVDVLARKLNIPVFATKGTINNCFLCSNTDLIMNIKNNETVRIAGMEVEAFSKFHNCEDPVSFKIRKEKTVSVVTDVGYFCGNVREAISDSDFLAIESNHDLGMLINGPYPQFLKNIISSEKGHISNLNSALGVLEHGKSRLKKILLSHLSKTNNTPELAFNTFKSLLKERTDLRPDIFLSLREKSTGLFRI
jgi:phosphoribosyl 1,2-cyclic phosphodiesterase